MASLIWCHSSCLCHPKIIVPVLTTIFPHVCFSYLLVFCSTNVIFKAVLVGTPGEGYGTPLQYSCLENPTDRGAWKAAVYGVAKSRTRLSDFTFTFHFHALEKEMATHSIQCSCLENPRDGGAWWAAVSGVAQSRTRLKRLSSSSSSSWHPYQRLIGGRCISVLSW